MPFFPNHLSPVIKKYKATPSNFFFLLFMGMLVIFIFCCFYKRILCTTLPLKFKYETSLTSYTLEINNECTVIYFIFFACRRIHWWVKCPFAIFSFLKNPLTVNSFNFFLNLWNANIFFLLGWFHFKCL